MPRNSHFFRYVIPDPLLKPNIGNMTETHTHKHKNWNHILIMFNMIWYCCFWHYAQVSGNWTTYLYLRMKNVQWCFKINAIQVRNLTNSQNMLLWWKQQRQQVLVDSSERWRWHPHTQTQSNDIIIIRRWKMKSLHTARTSTVHCAASNMLQ